LAQSYQIWQSNGDTKVSTGVLRLPQATGITVLGLFVVIKDIQSNAVSELSYQADNEGNRSNMCCSILRRSYLEISQMFVRAAAAMLPTVVTSLDSVISDVK